ncbi:MAG: sigma-54-dependent transcriptional regulator, partial [Thermodesulfobacteriota bacterium]
MIEQTGIQQEQKQFWLEKDIQEPPVLKGRSRHVRQIRSFAWKAAENDLPVLLIGEKGTGKLALSRYIYLKSKRKQDGFTTVDCSSIKRDYTGHEDKTVGTNEITLGKSQENALFGHLMGSQSFSNIKRSGYIEAAERGTIVIKNVENLTAGVQNKLLISLKTGFYKRVGSNECIRSNVKIIFTCRENVDELVKAGHLSNELYDFLLPQSIVLAPLRERKRDIPQMAIHFIVKYSKIEGIRPLGITKDTMNILLGCNWPNNIDQLEDTIYRAVRFSEGNTLTASRMFLDQTVTQKAGKWFNLLRLKPIRNLILGKIFSDAFRATSVTVYFFIIFLLLFGHDGYAKNTVILVWAIGWSVFLTGLFFTARLCCGLCPMRAIAETIQNRWNIKLALPDFIETKGSYIGVFGVAFILCAEQ